MNSNSIQARTRDWLRRKYNHRYAIAAWIQRALPAPGRGWLAKQLMDRLEERRPSLGSKLRALYLIDFRPEDEDLTLAIARQFSEDSPPYVQYRVGDRMLRGRLYIRETEAFLKRACDASFSIQATFRYLDYVTQVRGFSDPETARLSRRFRHTRFRKSFERSHKIKACTILLRMGKIAKAEALYLSLPQSVVRDGQLPIFLQRIAVKHQWRDHEFQQRGAELYKSVILGRRHFRDLIRMNHGSFCVVGNGPSEIGRGSGALIDGHSVVLRMNRYDLSNAADYGTKQTVWIRVPNAESEEEHVHRNAYVVIASNQFEYKRMDADKYLLKPHLLKRHLTTIPSIVFRELMQELHCLPSTGLAILYWIYKIQGPIPRERMFGFSHMEELADFRTHYFDDKIQRRLHVHAWEREAAIIARITT